ncbi:MAG: NUDIX hydrolase [Spirochaetes bacterium]|nr:NUDIX hydrolase [Spirochaetota bacterium]
MEKWQKKNRTEILGKKIFSIYDYECYHPGMKKTHTFSVIETSDWVNVIAETDDGRVLFIRQHRLGTDEITLEIPAGLIEPGESPETAAARELLEETGYEAEKISFMKKLAVNPAIMNNYVYFYHASGCRKVRTQNLDESEDIEFFLIDKSRIRGMIQNNEINHQVICSALLFYLGGYDAAD